MLTSPPPSPCPQSPPVTLVLGDESCWLSRLPLVPGEPDANAVIYRKGWYQSYTSPHLGEGGGGPGAARHGHLGAWVREGVVARRDGSLSTIHPGTGHAPSSLPVPAHPSQRLCPPAASAPPPPP